MVSTSSKVQIKLGNRGGGGLNTSATIIPGGDYYPPASLDISKVTVKEADKTHEYKNSKDSVIKAFEISN